MTEEDFGRDAGPVLADGASIAGSRSAVIVLLRALIVCGLVNAACILAYLYQLEVGRTGFLMRQGTPFGQDFINLWTVGRLVLSGDIATIYDWAAFMRYQDGFVGAYIGLRLWAYPPHSLLVAWPVGLLSYLPAFLVWSAGGLAFLAFAARRFGFDWTETAVLVLSPAPMVCIYYGQTGNVAAGLMLLAMAPGVRMRFGPVVSAALLTIKPQIGFLLPLLWIRENRWIEIAAAGAVTLALLGLSTGLFGFSAWHEYLTLTAPKLSELERNSIGQFMLMVCSLFMSLRLLDLPGDTALLIHAGFAVLVAATLVRRVASTADRRRHIAWILVGTSLITPYMHIYDVSLLVVAGLLFLRSASSGNGGKLRIAMAAMVVFWLAPYLVYGLALYGVPVMPAVLGALFLVI